MAAINEASVQAKVILVAESHPDSTIGVNPAFAGQSVGRAMMSQLLTNLPSLGVETVQTQARWNDFGLLGFLARCGFSSTQRLSFAHRVA